MSLVFLCSVNGKSDKNFGNGKTESDMELCTNDDCNITKMPKLLIWK